MEREEKTHLLTPHEHAQIAHAQRAALALGHGLEQRP